MRPQGLLSFFLCVVFFIFILFVHLSFIFFYFFFDSFFPSFLLLHFFVWPFAAIIKTHSPSGVVVKIAPESGRAQAAAASSATSANTARAMGDLRTRRVGDVL